MPRIRTIKPEFPQSESMGRVSRDARLLFVMLFTICDDDGRTRAASRMLASLLFPYDDDAPKLMDDWLIELDTAGCITRYEAEGAHYLQVNNWLKHQKIDRPTPSRHPDPRECSRVIAKDRESSSTDLVSGPSTVDLGDISLRSISAAPRKKRVAAVLSKEDSAGFEEFYAKYPRKEARRAAEKAYGGALGRGATQTSIMSGVAAYGLLMASEEKRYIAQPATWLNGDRWLDEHGVKAVRSAGLTTRERLYGVKTQNGGMNGHGFGLAHGDRPHDGDVSAAVSDERH